MKVFCFTLFLVLASFSLSGQAPKFSNDFLNIGVGARGMALGGAVSSFCSDVTAAYWNPSALVFMDAKFQIAGQHAQWYAGIGNYDYAAVGKSLDTEGKSFGAVSLIRMGIDDIPNTLRLRGPDGSIDYSRISTFSVSDYALLISYARKLGNSDLSGRWNVGGNFKIIHRSFGSFAKSYGFGIDAAISYKSEHWKLSLMGRDITTTFNAYKFSFSDEEKAVLQTTENEVTNNSIEITLPKIILGASYSLKIDNRIGFTPSMDLEISGNGTSTQLIKASNLGIDPRVGLEFDYQRKVFLRFGFNNFQTIPNIIQSNNKDFSVQSSGGIGLRIGKLKIDYALTNIANLGAGLYSHYVSLILNIR